MRLLRESHPMGCVAIAALTAIAVNLVVARRSPMTRESCRFEKTWYTGDQHYNEILELRGDMTGRWSEGGMGGGPISHIDFRWSRTDSTFTATFDSAEHTVRYKLEQREIYCRLILD